MGRHQQCPHNRRDTMPQPRNQTTTGTVYGNLKPQTTIYITINANSTSKTLSQDVSCPVNEISHLHSCCHNRLHCTKGILPQTPEHN